MWNLRTGFCCLGLSLLILSCAAESSKESTAGHEPAQRISRLADQIDQFKQRSADYEPFLESLEQWNQIRRPGRDGMWFERRAERVLWDHELFRNLEAQSEKGQENPLSSILHFARQLETAGIDFLVVFVPPRAAIYPDLTTVKKPLVASDEPPILDGYLREFYLQLERRGVEVLDLLPLFLEHPRQPWAEGHVPLPTDLDTDDELVFRRQDVHWSTHGSALAARAIAERVHAYGWWETTQRRQGRAHIQDRTRYLHEHGSITASLIKAGRLEPSEPKEYFLFRDAHIVGERWSLNDRSSPVVLLGDSFSRPEHGLPQQLLVELGFRVDRITVPMGNQSGQLQRLKLRGDGLAGKRLVIWQIHSQAMVGHQKWRRITVIDP